MTSETVVHQALSGRGRRTEALPISWLMQQAVEVPGLISLAAGLVDRETLPTERVQRLLTEILSDDERGRDALQYGTTPGLRRLRQQVVDRYVAGSAYADADRVVVGSGAQQHIELVGEALFDPGDIVIVEAPTYFVFTGVLKSFGVDVYTVPCDGEGIQVDALQALVAEMVQDGRGARLKAIYVEGYCQNPGGWSLSLARKQALAAMLDDLPPATVVIEDAAYYELVFNPAQRAPLLATLDPSGQRVATFLTADKPFAPGLKCGFAILPEWLVTPVVNLKGNHDFGSTNLVQHLIACAIESGDFDAQIETLRATYLRKSTVLSYALREDFGDALTWPQPEGGLYLWCTLDGIPTSPDSDLFQAALAHKVLYVPGSYAYAGTLADTTYPDCCMRLTFGVASDEELIAGARRLGAAWRSVTAKK